MAMATGYLNALGLKTVGLCHSVQGTTRMLARTLGVPYDEVSYVCAGINHQAWILTFRRGSEDLYPRLREVMTERHVVGRAAADLVGDDGDHSEAAAAASTYEGGNEQVRTTIMNHFGYFETESSHHASEYLPYFRKNPELVEAYMPERWDYYQICAAHDDQGDLDSQLAKLSAELEPSVEYGASIVNAVVTGTPAVVYGNVPNATGLISNLPPEACVEVPVPGRPQRRPAHRGRCAAAPARSAQPHQRQRADPGCAGCAHRRPGQRLPRRRGGPADRGDVHARAGSRDDRGAVRGPSRPAACRARRLIRP